jgi:hypothetical protein
MHLTILFTCAVLCNFLCSLLYLTCQCQCQCQLLLSVSARIARFCSAPHPFSLSQPAQSTDTISLLPHAPVWTEGIADRWGVHGHNWRGRCGGSWPTISDSDDTQYTTTFQTNYIWGDIHLSLLTNSVELSTTQEATSCAATPSQHFTEPKGSLPSSQGALPWSLSWARLVQSTPLHSISPG